jgi:hypothetical protein
MTYFLSIKTEGLLLNEGVSLNSLAQHVAPASALGLHIIFPTDFLLQKKSVFRPAKLHRLTELISWNRFLGFLNDLSLDSVKHNEQSKC